LSLTNTAGRRVRPPKARKWGASGEELSAAVKRASAGAGEAESGQNPTPKKRTVVRKRLLAQGWFSPSPLPVASEKRNGSPALPSRDGKFYRFRYNPEPAKNARISVLYLFSRVFNFANPNSRENPCKPPSYNPQAPSFTKNFQIPL
jgi:hypothetical protein